MARRGRYSGGYKFYQALTSPTSTRVFYCYAMHGKGYGAASAPKPSIEPVGVRILALNRARETWWEDGAHVIMQGWSCPALAGLDDWRLLGWTMPDCSLLFGELDAVDPELAQFEYLPDVNTPHHNSHSTPVLGERHRGPIVT
jgi:hypothetical protein